MMKTGWSNQCGRGKAWLAATIQAHYQLQYLDYQIKALILDSFSLSGSFRICRGPGFLAELSRVCCKCILICVPNRSGLATKCDYGIQSQLYPYMHLSYMILSAFQYLLCLKAEAIEY
jgi:hypothetical protein